MTAHVCVYQLRSKFVNRREDIPEDARQVVYYSLAVGHHVGVMDCFSSLVEIPLDEYRDWLGGLPEGPGRSKLEGVLRWGEIEINKSHVAMLRPLLKRSYKKPAWLPALSQCLQGMQQEPALYLMLRKRA
jgi:hypothetical protein